MVRSRTDRTLTAVTVVYVAGTISFAHSHELAIVGSSWPGVPVGVDVGHTCSTDRAVCRAGRLRSAAGIDFNQPRERG